MIFRYGGRGVPPIPLRRIALKSRYFRSKTPFFSFSHTLLQLSHLGPDREHISMWNFYLFFIEIWFFDNQNTFYLIVRGLKNAVFMPLYTSTVSEISIHNESGLCYVRNIHPTLDQLLLFQKYIPLWEACAISEITIHYESGLHYFKNIDPLWDEQQ